MLCCIYTVWDINVQWSFKFRKPAGLKYLTKHYSSNKVFLPNDSHATRGFGEFSKRNSSSFLIQAPKILREIATSFFWSAPSFWHQWFHLSFLLNCLWLLTPHWWLYRNWVRPQAQLRCNNRFWFILKIKRFSSVRSTDSHFMDVTPRAAVLVLSQVKLYMSSSCMNCRQSACTSTCSLQVYNLLSHIAFTVCEILFVLFLHYLWDHA